MSKTRLVGEEGWKSVSDLSRKELEEACAAFNVDGKDYIPIKALKVVMRSLGFEPRSDEISALTAKIMKNEAKRKSHPDGLSFEELTELLGAKMNERSGVVEIKAAFDLFDADSKGCISVDDLRTVAKELGEEISDEQLQEMISEADSKGVGSISQEDFCTVMKKTFLY